MCCLDPIHLGFCLALEAIPCGHVGLNPLAVDVLARRGEVLGGCDGRCSTTGKGKQGLNHALAKRPLAHQGSAGRIAQRPSQNLGRAGRELVDQHHGGQRQLGAGACPVRLPTSFPVNDVHDGLAVGHEPVRDLRGRTQQPAAVVPQVEDQPTGPLPAQLIERGGDIPGCLLVEGEHAHVAQAGALEFLLHSRVKGSGSLHADDLHAGPRNLNVVDLAVAANPQRHLGPGRPADPGHRLLQRHPFRGNLVDVQDAISGPETGAVGRRALDRLNDDQVAVPDVNEDPHPKEEPCCVLRELLEYPCVHVARVGISQRIEQASGRAVKQPGGLGHRVQVLASNLREQLTQQGNPLVVGRPRHNRALPHPIAGQEHAGGQDHHEERADQPTPSLHSPPPLCGFLPLPAVAYPGQGTATSTVSSVGIDGPAVPADLVV